MAARNTVDVVIRSKDEAKPDLTELRAKLEELAHTVATARAEVSDKDAVAKLAALELRLETLGRRVESPRITVQGARRAEVDLLRLDAQLSHIPAAAGEAEAGLKDVATEAENAGGRSGHGFMSKFASFVQPSKFQLVTSGVASGLAALPALGAVAGAGAGTLFAAKFLVGSKKAQGPLYSQFTSMTAGIKSVLTSAMQPMMGPLKQAFSSLGSFVKDIGPQLHAVFGAIGPMVAPLLHGLESLVSGVLPGFVALMRAAAPAVQVVAQLLGSLGHDLGGMFASFAPAVKASSVVLQAIGTVLNGILPVVGHLAASLATSLSPVLLAIGQALHALAPAIAVVGRILGALASAVLGSVSGALTAVAHLVADLAPTFGVLAKTMGQVFNLMENTGVFGVLEDALEQLAKPIAQLVNAFVAGLAPALPPIISLFSQLSSGAIQVLVRVLADLITGLTPFMPLLGQLTPLIVGIIGAVKAWSIAQTVLDAVMTANPIGLIVVAVGALIVAVVEVVKHWSAIAAVAKTAFHAVVSVIAGVIGWVKSHWTLILAILTGPVGLAVRFIAGHWREILAGAQHMITSVVGWFERLPGMILRGVGDLGKLLWNGGVNIIKGLIGGIMSMAGSVGHAIGGIVQDIRNFLPFSPAKKGPLSGSGSPHLAGAKIPAMLAEGMLSGLGPVSAAAGRMAGAVSGGAAGGGHGGHGGGVLTLRIEAGSRDALMDALMKALRLEVHSEGGNVQTVLGWG